MEQPSNLKSLLLLGKLPKAAPSAPALLSPSSTVIATLGSETAVAPSLPPVPPSSSEAVNVMTPVVPPVAPTTLPPLSNGMTNSMQFSSLVPALMTLKGQMMQDLEEHVSRLLTLNPSRREAIAIYLDRLANQTSSPSGAGGTGDAAGGLRRWIEGPRSPGQNAALRAYFEEVAIIYLSQAILLKAWSDAGIRPWNESDVGKLNWSLSTALKPLLPIDREGWQVTRPNLYSWYTPSNTIQHQVWLTLDQARMSEDGPSLLFSISGPARQARPEAVIPHGYDLRFFNAIWKSMPGFGADFSSDNGPIKRHRVAFSPSLRDGTMVRTGPSNLHWAGMEQCPFQLMIAELMQLWWGPQAPPIWGIGSGLEAHTRDQLSLGLNSPKPSLLSKIAEMEACDVSFVLEERTVRSQGRNAEAQRFRDQLDSLPYFKKLKSPGTSLGDLQACMTLSKLRPGGLMWWGREEPLSQQDGPEVLSFLLERSKIVCEWDFSHLEHALPTSLPLFPKYLYLLSRETRVEERLSHRPLRITLSGQIRSHIELPVMLQDALESATQANPQPRGQYQIHQQVSPTPQKDWAERWPDAASQNTLRALEKLRSVSNPLANACTVQAVSALSAEQIPANWQNLSADGGSIGVWLRSQDRELSVLPLHQVTPNDVTHGGFTILVPDPSWTVPLAAYLCSQTVREWLDHHAERKGDKWSLNEQTVRWIPIPKSLLKSLQALSPNAPQVLSAEWEKLIQEASQDSKKTKQVQSIVATRLPNDEAGLDLRAAFFVKTAQMLDHMKTTKKRLLAVVDSQGRINWCELLQVLPKSELIPLSTHPQIQISGNLPPHLPITRIDKVKTPSPGFMLSTELGLFIHLACGGATEGTRAPSVLTDMLWEQLSSVQHPTWSELVQSVKLPRRLDFAQSTAQDVLKSHAESVAHLSALGELLIACSVF